MPISNDLNLYKKQPTLGRFLYFCFASTGSMLLYFVDEPNGPWIYMMLALILSAGFGCLVNLQIYIFNDKFISVFYRMFFLISCYESFQAIFQALEKNAPSLDSFGSFIGAYFITLIISVIIGALVSVPFKFCAYFCGTVSNDINQLYNEKASIPDFVGDVKPNLELELSFYNETQLKVALESSLEIEDYEKAKIIQKILTEKYHD
jgi:hypothetical protein